MVVSSFLMLIGTGFIDASIMLVGLYFSKIWAFLLTLTHYSNISSQFSIRVVKNCKKMVCSLSRFHSESNLLATAIVRIFTPIINASLLNVMFGLCNPGVRSAPTPRYAVFSCGYICLYTWKSSLPEV